MVSAASALISPMGLASVKQRKEISRSSQERLLQGEILLQTRSHSLWGGAVTAQMYLPIARSQAWQSLTDYGRWVQYFPDMTRSEILSQRDRGTHREKQLYQAARKTFFLLTAQVEIYLNVLEVAQPDRQQIQFQLQRGSFNDFGALLELQDMAAGTLLTYAVQATPTIPIPTQFIQEAIKLDFPNNLRQMRRSICDRA